MKKRYFTIYAALVLSISICMTSHASIIDMFKSLFNNKNVEETIEEKENIYESLDTESKEVANCVKEIYDAITVLDFKKVVSYTDYVGTYDTRYIDEFFNNYPGTKDIVLKVINDIKIDIKEVKKEDEGHKVKVDIDMIDLEKVLTSLVPRIGADIVAFRFTKGKVTINDIIDMVAKRIGENIDKGKTAKINFDYEFVFRKVGDEYKLSTKDIIEDIYNKLEPFFDAIGDDFKDKKEADYV